MEKYSSEYVLFKYGFTLKDGQYVYYDKENKYDRLCGGSWSNPILQCPKCKKWSYNLFQHSKSIKCNFDFEKEFKFKEKFEQKLKDHTKVSKINDHIKEIKKKV
jgi:hypothetical protein